MSRFNPKLGAFINDDEPELIVPLSKLELKNCKDCIALDKCPSGKRNPMTRVCISDEELIKSQIKEKVLNLAEVMRGEE